MRCVVLFSRVLLYGIVMSLLVSCGLAGQTAQHSGAKPAQQIAGNTAMTSLMKVDWANFTYSSSCYGNKQPFHTQKGVAVNDGVHFNVYSPTYGNLTGKGQIDAVVPYQCSAADASGVRAFVYSGTTDHPVLIGDLPLPDPRGSIEDITKITISNQQLQLEGRGYSLGAPHCCPDLFIKTSYKWQGKNFVVVQNSVSKL